MSGPRRLRDDPSFKLRTGIDLSAEANLITVADLGAQKARLLTTIGAGAGLSAGLIAAITTTMLGGGLLLALSTAPSPPPAPAPLAVSPPATAPIALEPPLVTLPSTSPPPASPPPAPSLTHSASPPSTSPPPASSPPAPPPSSIQAQVSAYDAARAEMNAGHLTDAEQAFAAYLTEWPDGLLAEEARLARLSCLYRLERWSEVVTLGEQITVSGAAADEVIRMQIDALEHSAHGEDQ